MPQKDINNDKFDFDVIIVGGGPAGVVSAITIAEKGYSVAILDKKSRMYIGDKTCGDAVDKAALQRVKDAIGLDFPKDNEISDTIKTMSIAAGGIDQKLSLIAPGYVVDRLNFGQRLLQKAEELDVKIFDNSPVRGIITEKQENKLFLSGVEFFKEGKKSTLRSKITIDASGAYAVIRRQLPDEFLKDGITRDLTMGEYWPSYREIIELKEGVADHEFDNEIILLYKSDFPPPGYFWIFSKGKRRLNCGIGWMKYQSKELGGLKKGYLQEMSNYYTPDEYTVLKSGGGQIPVRPPFDSLVFNGGALVGDAACMVHPVTAEGHGPALDTAVNLGQAVIKALSKNSWNKEALWDYNIAVSQHYAKKHHQALLMRNFLEKVGASGLEYLIAKQIFRNEELDLVFSGLELQLSFLDKLKKVAKLLLKPKLLYYLKQIFDLIDKCEEVFDEYPSHPNQLQQWRVMRDKALGYKSE